MVVSLNTKAIYKTKANLFNGGFGYTNGDILIGDRAFEFYNHQNPESYLQIPWEEIKRLSVSKNFSKDKEKANV